MWIERRDIIRPGRADPQEFDSGGHRVGRELPAACSGARTGALFDLAQLIPGHPAGRHRAHRLEHFLKRDVLSAVATRTDGAAVERQSREVQPDQRHHGGRDRLVAADDHHQSVEEMAADNQLDRVGDHLAADKRGLHALGSHRHAVRHRDRVELHGRSASGPDAGLHLLGQAAPRPGHAFDLGLAAEAAFGADLAGDAGDLVGERRELVDHRVQRVLELEDLAACVDRDLLRQIALGDGGRDFGDVAHLARQVSGHGVDVVCEVLPGAADARHLRLATEFPFRTDFARHAGHLGSEAVELVDHRVDGVLEPEDLAAHVDRDLFREVAPGDRGRDLRDVAHLGGQVAGHVVDVVRQVLPNTGDAGHLGLAAELTFRTDLARHPGDLPGEGVQLVDHDVDGFLELEDFALDFDCDLLGEVAFLNGGGDLGDIPHLRRQVARHEVHAVGKVLPDAADAAHLRLAAELALRTNLAGDPGDF